MLLDNAALQNHYARGVTTLYNNWRNLAENERRAILQRLLSEVAGMANLPMPKLVWLPSESSFFRLGVWEIHASLSAMTLKPSSDFKTWLHKITSPYHELRHADQHRIIMEAFMTKAVALPVLFSRNIVRINGDLPKTLVQEGYPYPMQILTRIRMQKAEFQQAWIPQARAWSDSIFGRFANARQHTMNTLAAHGKGIHYGAYRALPEEADAFQVQTQVKRSIKAMIGDDVDLSDAFDMFA